MNMELIIYLVSMAAIYVITTYRGSSGFAWIVVFFAVAWLIEDYYQGNVAIAYAALALFIVVTCESLLRSKRDPFSIESFRKLLLSSLSALGMAPRTKLRNAKGQSIVKKAVQIVETEEWKRLEDYITELDDESRFTVIDGLTDEPSRPAFVSRWLQARPDSHVAAIISGFCYVNAGWEARGSGTTDTVTNEGWEQFYDELTKAQDEFDRAIDLSDSCYSAYLGLIRIGMGMGSGSERIWRYFVRGSTLAPNNYHLHRAMMHACAPKWGGDAGDMFSIAQKALAESTAEATVVASLAVAHIEHWLSIAMMERDSEAEEYFRQKSVKADLKKLNSLMNDWPIKTFAKIEALNVLAFCLDKAEMALEFRAIAAKLKNSFISYPWCYSEDSLLATLDERYALDSVLKKHGLLR